ncbi:MAG TPA: HAMP domain-containing sensor histidine kinase [Planctomycetota bacterium]|nr:HAMP domain-containing sensor histidine kinase [Planctomycetota bacterium]
MSQSLHVQFAVLIEAREDRPRTFVWHAPGVPEAELQAAKGVARRAHKYLGGFTPSGEWLVGTEHGEEVTVSLGNIDEGDAREKDREITLPLVVAHHPVFGVLYVKCRSPVDDVDVAFLSAAANLLALALDADRARRQELALRKKAEELARSEEAARIVAQEAVRARDALVSIASHELKNPLGALSMQIALLVKQLEGHGDEVMTSKLFAAKRQIGRMTRLIDNLLDVSRITAGRLDLELEDVDLSEVVRDVTVRSADELRSSGCALTVEAGPSVGRWDRLRLDQIVTNLLSNAMKYGKGKPIEVRVESDEKRTLLSVADHGIGISPEDQKRVFERFERAADTRAFEGFGLGLWIVRQIVEALGGTIRVASQVGVGSTFTVDLPRSPGADRLQVA